MTPPLGSYLSKRGYVLRKEHLSNDEYIHLKTELRGRPLEDKNYHFYGHTDTSYPLYTETKNKLYIPKMYGLLRYGQPQSKLSNYIGLPFVNDISFNGTLFDYQIEATDALYTELTNGSGGGILQMYTGGGKSCSALNVLSRLGGKAIIVVNKIPLMKQWQSEIAKFLPNAQVGIIQGGKKVDVVGKDIVIAMLQSLAKIDYPEEVFNDFRVTLVDEVHNTSSRVFSGVLTKLCSQYTIGLSATPKRSDGCEYVFKWFLGDVVHAVTSERKGLDPIVQTIKLNSKDYKEISTENKITGGKVIQFTSMLTDLIAMEPRNKLIIDTIKKCIGEGRKVLVMSDRREHIKTIKQMLDKDRSVTFTYGMFLGQMKMTDLEKAKASQCILATYAAFGEGVSERDLDTLLLVTPKKFIGHLKNTTKHESGKLEQIVGRIFRKEHVDKNPLIIDFQDNFSIYKNQARQRNTFYKTHFTKVTIQPSAFDLDNQKWTKALPEEPAPQNNLESQLGALLSTHCLLD